MALYTVFNASPPSTGATEMFQTGATITARSPTSTTYTNPNGTKVVINGAGFTYDVAGVPTGGVIGSITLFDATQTTQWIAISGLAVNLTGFHASWLGVGQDGFDALALVMAGADTMTGSKNADTLQGVAGDDLINGGDGDDYMDGYKGADTINGGAGNDMLSYSWGLADPAITKGITVDLNGTTAVDPWGSTDTISGIEQVRSTRFADTLVGNAANNTFQALAGNDTIDGGAGIDRVSHVRDQTYGGAAGVKIDLRAGKAVDGFGNTDTLISIEEASGSALNDSFQGGDTILPNGALYAFFGQAGNDTATAGAGGLYVEPGAGNDTVVGGSNTSDQVSYAEYTGANGVTVNLATGVVLDPYGGKDSVTGMEGARLTKNGDTFIGDASNNFVRGLGGADTLDGGGGLDRVIYDRDAQFGGTKGVTINHKTGKATDGFGTVDTLISIERARGTAFADTWQGGDTRLGLSETYEFQGLDGDDTITAGAWDIYVEPGAGNDTIKGGAGTDQVSYAEADTGKGAVFNYVTGVINDPYGGTDTVSGVEGMRGTSHGDMFTGNAGANFVRGLDGNDTLDGGGGVDEVRYDRDAQYGGSAGVVVDLATGLATDGFGAFDTLISIEDVRGSGQADLLTGSAGANVLRGLGGTDTLDGRGGVDTANYAADAVFGGNAGIVVDLGAGWALDGYGDADALVSIENIVGTDGASMVFLGYSDLVIGSAGANRLEGRGGNDVLSGGGGTDTLIGDAGDDLLSGDAGNDTIIGGAGLDVMVGGADADTFTIDLAALINQQGDLVYDFQIGLDSIVVPLSVQGQTAFIDQAVTVSLAGGGLYWMIVSGATAAEIQAATKFT